MKRSNSGENSDEEVESVKMKNWMINCDMGEGMENDIQIMSMIDECSIACGGHTGDEQSMSRTVELALENNVKIGAHPSFPDRENFGRELMIMGREVLLTSLVDQVNQLQTVCESFGTEITHIKPHGALYNHAAIDQTLAEVITDMMKAFPGIELFAPWKSLMSNVAEKADIKITYEAFADRRYNKDLTLVSRKKDRAIITRPELTMRQVLSIATQDRVITIDGESVELKATSFCMHGDNPNVIEILSMINDIKE